MESYSEFVLEENYYEYLYEESGPKIKFQIFKLEGNKCLILLRKIFD